MPTFKKIKLADVCTKIGSGSTPRGGDASYKTEGTSLIRSQNVLDFEFSKNGLAFIDDVQAKELANVAIQERDVLLNITGDSVARVCQVPKDVLPARVNQHVLILRTDKSKLNPDFLKYSLLSRQNKEMLLSLASTGATRKALTKVMLEEFEIDAPPDLPTQTRIASILSALDDKIELNRQMNQTLEQMAQALFKKYFVTDVDPDNLPEGWKLKSVGELFEISIGRTPPRKESKWFTANDKDVKWISIKDLGNCGSHIFQTSEFLTNEAVAKFNIPVIPENTVVLSFKLTVGRVAITTEKMLSNEAIAHFIPKSNNYLSSIYTYVFLKNFNYEILGSTSSIATAVNSQSVKSIQMLVPPIGQIENYSGIVKPIFDLIKNNDLENINLSKTRDTLLPKLMSGEIEVTAEIENTLTEPIKHKSKAPFRGLGV